jgi:hypothetical protein
MGIDEFLPEFVGGSSDDIDGNISDKWPWRLL